MLVIQNAERNEINVHAGFTGIYGTMLCDTADGCFSIVIAFAGDQRRKILEHAQRD